MPKQIEKNNLGSILGVSTNYDFQVRKSDHGPTDTIIENPGLEVLGSVSTAKELYIQNNRSCEVLLRKKNSAPSWAYDPNDSNNNIEVVGCYRDLNYKDSYYGTYDDPDNNYTLPKTYPEEASIVYTEPKAFIMMTDCYFTVIGSDSIGDDLELKVYLPKGTLLIKNNTVSPTNYKLNDLIADFFAKKDNKSFFSVNNYLYDNTNEIFEVLKKNTLYKTNTSGDLDPNLTEDGDIELYYYYHFVGSSYPNNQFERFRDSSVYFTATIQNQMSRYAYEFTLSNNESITLDHQSANINLGPANELKLKGVEVYATNINGGLEKSILEFGKGQIDYTLNEDTFEVTLQNNTGGFLYGTIVWII